MPTQTPPLTGNEELDQFNYDVHQSLNHDVGSGVDTEVDDEGRTVIDGITIGYQERYLETAYGTDANGANFSQTISGLPPDFFADVWQGVRNQASNIASNNPAEFTWRCLLYTSPSPRD